MKNGPRSEAERNLAIQREARDRARAGFSTRVELLRGQLAPEKLATRVIDDLTYKSRGIVGQAIEIASDNRGIAVGALAALAVWVGRRPVGRGIAALAHRITSRKPKGPAT